MRIATWLVAGLALLLSGNAALSQQLKLGSNPFTVQKSAVLELNSTNQGLLLARIADTTLINALSPPDGMVIFFTPTKQLLIRSNGYWQPMAVGGTAISSLNGLTAATQTFTVGTSGATFNIASSGSTHTFNIPDASATARGEVTTAAQTFAGAKSFSSTLLVAATNPLTLNGVQLGTTTTSDSLLTINSGIVKKLPLSTFVTSPGITSLNGLAGNTQTFAVGTSGTTFNITSTGTAHTFNIPDASATARGEVTTAAQTFAGAKSFSSIVQVSATNPLTLNGVQLGTTTTNDSLLTINSGIVKKLPLSTFSTAGTSWLLGGNTVGNIKNFGSIDNFDVPFITSNTERMRIDASGHVGIGVTNPANPLVVKDTLEIRRTGTVSELLFTNTAGSGDFRIGGDGGDIFWQGGGGRSLQMGSYWGMLLAGDRQTGTFPAFTNGSGNTNVTIQAQRDISIPLAIQANSATQTGNLTEWRTSAGTVLNAVDKSGNFGLGTTVPSTKLHVVGTNPLTLIGVQTGTNTSADSLLTITSGLVRKLPASTFVTAGSFWATGGNTVGAIKNFGTIDNFDLPFITNNTEKMRLSAGGSLGIGTSSFNGSATEKLLIDQGTTGSFNSIVARGTINNYMQFNIQNLSAGTSASSDMVATADNGSETTNFVDLGINSSGNTAAIFGSPNDAYLYNLGQNLLIGTGTAAKSLVFLTGGTTQSTNERMRIDGTGKVGINTTAPAAQLDNAGTFKMGATGSVNKNQISFEYVISSTTVTAASLIILGIGYAVNAVDVTATIPSGSLPSTTRGSVSISPDQDLPAGVSIAWARVATTSTVKVRFVNSNSAANATLPAGLKLWITINEF